MGLERNELLFLLLFSLVVFSFFGCHAICLSYLPGWLQRKKVVRNYVDREIRCGRPICRTCQKASNSFENFHFCFSKILKTRIHKPPTPIEHSKEQTEKRGKDTIKDTHTLTSVLLVVSDDDKGDDAGVLTRDGPFRTGGDAGWTRMTASFWVSNSLARAVSSGVTILLSDSGGGGGDVR